MGRDRVHFGNQKIETGFLSSGKWDLPFVSNEMRKSGGLRHVLVTSQSCWYQFCQLVQSLICAHWLFCRSHLPDPIKSVVLYFSFLVRQHRLVPDWQKSDILPPSWQTLPVCHHSFPSQIQCQNLNKVLQVVIADSSELVDNLRPICQLWVKGANATSSLF